MHASLNDRFGRKHGQALSACYFHLASMLGLSAPQAVVPPLQPTPAAPDLSSPQIVSDTNTQLGLLDSTQGRESTNLTKRGRNSTLGKSADAQQPTKGGRGNAAGVGANATGAYSGTVLGS